MNDEILGDAELARLLKVSQHDVTRLLLETSLPRFFIGGEARFLKASVLAFCARNEGLDLLPLAVAETASLVAPIAEANASLCPCEVSPFPTAAEGEQSWVATEARDALLSGASDPGRNLDRLRLRDALLELNDQLLPALTRRSVGRLHPHYDEKSRTSPWRLDFDGDSRIDAISIAWGAGDHAPPRFGDRPHLEVELRASTLEVFLDTHGRTFDPPLEPETASALAEAGFALLPLGEDHVTRVSKTYPMPDPSPPTAVIARSLEADLEHLVPLWVRLV